MNRILVKLCIALLVWISSFATSDAHDAWLAAKWNAKKTHILISPVVAETFPKGEPIKDMKRFIDPSAHFPDGSMLPLGGDPTDSTVLGSVPLAPSFVVSAGVKQREITYNQDIARAYLTEEVGLTKDQTSEILSDTVKEFNETYSRYLKTVVSVNDNVPIDTTCGLPLEIVLLSCKTALGQEAAIKFRLLHNGEPSIDSPIRVLSNGTATIVRTDSTGAAQAMVAKDKPLLLAHTQITKLSENRLQSVWTNLAVYWIKK